MNKCISIVIVFFLACGHQRQQTMPLGVSLMPPELDLTKLLPPVADSKVACKESAPKFDPVVVTGGTLTEGGKTKPVQAGVLVDECTFTQENIANLAELNRTRRELSVLRELRVAERKIVQEVEQRYQERIKELQAEPGFVERNRFEIGMLAGIVLTTLIVFGVNQASK